jgi:hypothetical protein
VVIVTGNHYLLDAVAGAAIVAAVHLITAMVSTRSARPQRRPGPWTSSGCRSRRPAQRTQVRQ